MRIVITEGRNDNKKGSSSDNDKRTYNDESNSLRDCQR